MKNTRLILSALIFGGLIVSAQAQIGIPGEAPTPTASSLGRYGDIPVSYYTGNTDISIPLYTINSHGLEMPIVLRYDGSGIPLNALPGWVGHSWALQAGGVITRQMNGRDDEALSPKELPGANRVHSYFQSYNYLYDCVRSKNYSALEYNCSMRNLYDVEPDVFFFNFMGKTGKFMLDHQGQWRVYSEENLEVINDVNNDDLLTPFISRSPNNNVSLPKTIAGFKIRDDKGYLYEFGYTTDAIEYSRDFLRSASSEIVEHWHATSWYLTKVTDKYGNVLFQLTYERGKFIAQLYNVNYFTKTNISSGNYIWGIFDFTTSSEQFSSATNAITGQLHAPVFLKKITGGGIQIDFTFGANPNLRGDLLFPNLTADNMKSHVNGIEGENFEWMPFYYLQTTNINTAKYQYNPSGSNVKNVLARTCGTTLSRMEIRSIYDNAQWTAFSLSYNSQSRIHLTEVRSVNANGKVYSYKFDYHNFNLLPSSYLTKKIDHWGYYNGMDYSTMNTSSNTTSYESSRNTNATCCLYGMMTRITYPTGGISVIEYEPNSYSKYINRGTASVVSSDGIGGGVRVKSIAEYEDVQKSRLLSKRSFVYTLPNGKSSGELFAKPRYSWANWKGSPAEGSYTYTTFRSSSIVPLANAFGPAVGYTYVEERFGDGGKNVYHYSNISSAMDKRPFLEFRDHSPSPYDKLTERGYKRGRLLDVTYYDGTNSKVSSTAYEYRNDDMERDSVVACNLTALGGGPASCLAGGVYNILYPNYYITKKTETMYFSSGNVVTTTTYTKTENQNMVFQYTNTKGSIKTHSANTVVLNKEVISRNGQSHQVIYQYGGTASYRDLREKYHDLCPSSTWEYLDGRYTKSVQTVYRNEIVNGKQQPVPAYTTENRPSTVDTLYVYEGYTSKGSLSQYRMADGQRVYYGYARDDNFIIWKGVGALAVQIPLADSKVFDTESLLNTLKPSRSANPDLMLTIYTYHPLYGVKSITNPSGYTTYYNIENGFLRDIKDHHKRTLQHFDYNFRQ